MSPARGVARTAAAAALAFAFGWMAGCKTAPPFPVSRSAGTNCGDPCAVMQCPSGYDCSWNEQCHPRCEMRLPQPQFSR